MLVDHQVEQLFLFFWSSCDLTPQAVATKCVTTRVQLHHIRWSDTLVSRASEGPIRWLSAPRTLHGSKEPGKFHFRYAKDIQSVHRVEKIKRGGLKMFEGSIDGISFRRGWGYLKGEDGTSVPVCHISLDFAKSTWGSTPSTNKKSAKKWDKVNKYHMYHVSTHIYTYLHLFAIICH